MLQHASALPLVFLMFPLMFSILSVSTANSNIYVHCSQLNFTSMTPCESNVNSLFTSLVNSASIYNFYKFETSSQNDVVYGLFQCRGDLSSLNCNDCVASAVSQLKKACPTSSGGEIQLEGCYVKYDNASFFGVQEKTEVCRRCGPSIGYNSDVLSHIDGALAYLVGGNGQYYRGGDFGSIQGVAQCVQDLSLSDCQDCLSEACGLLRTECVTSTWGDMYLGKCYIRYADQGDENLANNGNSNSSSNKNSGGGSKHDILKWIGYIIAAAVGAGGLTFAAKNTNINVTNKQIKNVNKVVEETNKQIKNVNKVVEETKKEAELANSVAKSAKSEAEYAKSEAEYAKSEAKSAKSEAKSAKEKAETAEKTTKKNKDDSTLYFPCGMPPPPTCPYYPYMPRCYYLYDYH